MVRKSKRETMCRKKVISWRLLNLLVMAVAGTLMVNCSSGGEPVHQKYQKIPHLPAVATRLSSVTRPQDASAQYRCGVICKALAECTIFCLSSTNCSGFLAPARFIFEQDWTSIPAASQAYEVCYMKESVFPFDIKALPLGGTAPDNRTNNLTNSVDGLCDSGGPYYHSVITTNPWWEVRFPSPQLISRVIVAMDYGHLHYNDTLVQVRVNNAVGSGNFTGKLLTKVSGTVVAGQKLVYQPTQAVMGQTVSIQSIGLSYLTLCEVYLE